MRVHHVHRAVGVATWLLVSNAFAQNAPRVPIQMQWNAPEACPSREQAIARIERLLRHNAETTADAPLSLHAVLQSTNRGTWMLELETNASGVRGHRVLEADTCSHVVSAMAVVVALAVDPEVEMDEEGLAEVTELATMSVVGERPAAILPHLEVRPEALRVRGFARVVGGVEVGVLPFPVWQAGVGGGISYGVFRAELVVQTGSWQRVMGVMNAEAELRPLALVSARSCLITAGRAWGVGGCAGIDVGWMEGTGRNVTMPLTGGATWWSADARGVAEIALGKWVAVRGDVGLGIVLQSPSFWLAGARLTESSRVSFRGGVGIEFRWP